jgi:hypothetical protein
VREFRQAAAELSSLTASAPSPDLRARVMAEIATTRQLSPLPQAVVRLADRRRSRVVRATISIAAAAVLFVGGALIFGRTGDDRFGEQVAAMLNDPDVKVAKLHGDRPGTFTVVWTDGRAAVLADDLHSPGSGKAYELWMIDEAGAHAVELLDPADDGTIERVVAVAGEPSAWGITIEDESGSDTPTMPIVFQADV